MTMLMQNRGPVGIAANNGVDMLETPVDLHLSLDPVVLGANHFWDAVA